MNIMEKAQKRAILTIDSEYVFNDIYFGTEEGMTSTSATHVSAMANVMVQDIKQHIMGLRLWEKSIRVIGDVECKVETVNNTLPEIADGVKRICKANALIAWLREAVKERAGWLDVALPRGRAVFERKAETFAHVAELKKKGVKEKKIWIII